MIVSNIYFLLFFFLVPSSVRSVHLNIKIEHIISIHITLIDIISQE